MAPLDPNTTAQSNFKPVALFSAQILLVAGLTTRVLLTARRAARELPPSTATRAQQPVRRRHALTFSVLAFLSLASVTTFSVMWRAMSYLHWAQQGNHEVPGSLWSGWYGTGDEGVGRWRLGDWLSDRNLMSESDAIAVAIPETFLYTSEHFVGLLTTALFMGAEGIKYAHPKWTVLITYRPPAQPLSFGSRVIRHLERSRQSRIRPVLVLRYHFVHTFDATSWRFPA
jgi:hypothetical protein